MALDGVVDPVAATTSTEAVLASGSADTDRVFRKLLGLCEAAGPERCALAGTAARPRRPQVFRPGRPGLVAPGRGRARAGLEGASVLYAAATGSGPTARPAARRLGNAVLLTQDGDGHLSRRDPSACVVQATGRYLVELTTPAPGTVCPSDRVPFDPSFGQPGS